MKVIVDGKEYDANDVPIKLVLTPQDRLNILGMHPNALTLLASPQSYGVSEIVAYHKDKEVEHEFTGGD